MGFNTVLMLHNDNLHLAKADPKLGEKIYDALRQMDYKPDAVLSGYFNYGYVISCHHADYNQIVVVSRNQGQVLQKIENPDRALLDSLAEYLKDHDYNVSKKRKSE